MGDANWPMYPFLGQSSDDYYPLPTKLNICSLAGSSYHVPQKSKVEAVKKWHLRLAPLSPMLGKPRGSLFGVQILPNLRGSMKRQLRRLQSGGGRSLQTQLGSAAHHAVLLLLVGEGMCVHPSLSHVHPHSFGKRDAQPFFSEYTKTQTNNKTTSAGKQASKTKETEQTYKVKK